MAVYNMPDNPFPLSNLKLSQAYILYQQYRDLFNIEEGLYRGTIFKELYQPYKKQYTGGSMING